MKVFVADFITAIGEHRFPERERAHGGVDQPAGEPASA